MKTTKDRPAARTLYSDLIRNRPSFLTGLASLWDFAGALNRPRRSSFDPDADARALASDWRAVGSDLWAAMGQFEEETGMRVAEKPGPGGAA